MNVAEYYNKQLLKQLSKPNIFVEMLKLKEPYLSAYNTIIKEINKKKLGAVAKRRLIKVVNESIHKLCRELNPRTIKWERITNGQIRPDQS